jgi:hypothetical protein
LFCFVFGSIFIPFYKYETKTGRGWGYIYETRIYCLNFERRWV